MGQFQDSLIHNQEALAICHELDDWCTGEILNDLGNAYRGLAQLKLAIEHYQQALAIRRDIGDLHGEAETLHNLGEGYQRRGAMNTAMTCYKNALAIWRRIGDQPAAAATLKQMASMSA